MNDEPHAAGDPEELLPDDPRLAPLVQEFLRELEAGRQPDRRAWLRRHPDLAAALGPCLEGLELVWRAAPLASALPIRSAAAGNEVPLAASPLGDFQIVREIGRGGMGIVYEAVQLSLGRRVALKVLPLAATFDAKHLQRFQQEAQAAAQLHHAHIVPVYGVGCQRGIHFYAMQLIEGQSLDEVIRHLRQDAGLPPPDADSADTQSFAPGEGGTPASEAAFGLAGEQISTCFSAPRTAREPGVYRTIARCMAQAAEALEYAHQQGVVHRDIKPANLLLDARLQLWITDFGLAYFHDAPGLTRTGDVLGTIRYMSPEQASGQRVLLDHRTDIYSLGATFYELATLHPVFAGRTRQALLADVLNREPRKPRAIDRRIPEELELILLKTLAKNPAERYATAQDVADDLHRYLRDEPIRARRPSVVDRLRKWARRHPSLIAAGVLAMFLTLVVSLVANWRVAAANERARAALAVSQAQTAEAEKRFQQARQAADLLIEISQQDLGDKPPVRSLRKRLLETALAYYKDFISQRGADDAGQAELVAVRDRVKRVLDELAVLEGAGQFLLLSDRRVQADLKLSAQQCQAIDTLAEEFARKRIESLREFPQLASPERRARFVELARAGDHAMRATLTAAQLQRLEQITRQLQGPMALGRSDVVAALHLTDAQRQALDEIEREWFAPPWERMTPGNAAAERPAHDISMRGALEQMLSVLTPEQMTQWKTLTGEPFKDLSQFLPPGMRP